MLLDNKTGNTDKVHEKIEELKAPGTYHTVTGYFSVAGLIFVDKQLNDLISEFQFILGELTSVENERNRPLDLLNENISMENALSLNPQIMRLIEFLRQEKVKIKTLRPNFCHAKTYIFKSAGNKAEKNYFIAGSSNLTEAGIGLKKSSNIELNIYETGTNSNYTEMLNWFRDLWENKEAKETIEVDGKIHSFKEHIISELKKIIKEYTPEELYYKVLYELFKDEVNQHRDDPDFMRDFGKLENTAIYQNLFEFQRKGVLNLVRMLQDYDGAILADAVGLGKTWTALAVMKFFQMKGFDVILLCPKKLQHNWQQYKSKMGSKFDEDNLNYTIRFHTDLQDKRLENYDDHYTIKGYFQSDRPKLIVIDESHNLRNDKSSRYQLLLNELIKKNQKVKTLLLSATPINNSLLDIRNQFNLIAKGNPSEFEATLGIRNLMYSFSSVQRTFHQWKENQGTISDFIKDLPHDFFKLTDAMVVARTRKMIEGQEDGLKFPIKTKPENIYVTPSQIGYIESFEEISGSMPPLLSAYQPAFYIKQAADVKVTEDERQRDKFLVKMMYMLIAKRLESSWFSMQKTVNVLLKKHKDVFDLIKAYEKNKKNELIRVSEEEFEEDFEAIDIEEEDFSIGSREIKIADIDAAGNLKGLKDDLKKDIERLDHLANNLKHFEEQVKAELSSKNLHKSNDLKLEKLMQNILKKQKTSENKKVIVFTVYKDTAVYLYEQLIARGFTQIGLVAGDDCRTTYGYAGKKFESILQSFAPYTKLYLEKKWNSFVKEDNQSILHNYTVWKNWILETKNQEVLDCLHQPIEILISTDVLSEGQNLQDCDMVVNYDIHWNPVRILQRFGRIDRLGSPNETIHCVNFWPSKNINEYLRLQSRIEDKMIAMKLSGAELPDEFTDNLKSRIQDESLEKRQVDKMLLQMEMTIDDIELEKETLGLDDFTLKEFRDDLLSELNKDRDKYENIPNAVYTGFHRQKELTAPEGIVALVGYPNKDVKVKNWRYNDLRVIYIDHNGVDVLKNERETLRFLKFHKAQKRFVPESIDKGNNPELTQKLGTALKNWLKSQYISETKTESGETVQTAGKSTLDLLKNLKAGNKEAFTRIKEGVSEEEKFQLEKFDLITWFIVSK